MYCESCRFTGVPWRWIGRFNRYGIDGLTHDREHSGRPTKIPLDKQDELTELLIALAKSILLNGASSGIVAGAANNPIQGLIQARHQRLDIFGDEINESFCLDP
jgi:hypothetical protein